MIFVKEKSLTGLSDNSGACEGHEAKGGEGRRYRRPSASPSHSRLILLE